MNVAEWMSVSNTVDITVQVQIWLYPWFLTWQSSSHVDSNDQQTITVPQPSDTDYSHLSASVSENSGGRLWSYNTCHEEISNLGHCDQVSEGIWPLQWKEARYSLPVQQKVQTVTDCTWDRSLNTHTAIGTRVTLMTYELNQVMTLVTTGLVSALWKFGHAVLSIAAEEAKKHPKHGSFLILLARVMERQPKCRYRTYMKISGRQRCFFDPKCHSWRDGWSVDFTKGDEWDKRGENWSVRAARSTRKLPFPSWEVLVRNNLSIGPEPMSAMKKDSHRTPTKGRHDRHWRLWCLTFGVCQSIIS